MLLELGRLRVSVVTVPFSVGEDGYEDGTLVASSDSHDSLEVNEESQNRPRWGETIHTCSKITRRKSLCQTAASKELDR